MHAVFSLRGFSVQPYSEVNMQRFMRFAFALLVGVTFVSQSLAAHKTAAPAKKAFAAKVAAKTVKDPKPRALKEEEFNRFLAQSPWPKKLHGSVRAIAFCESSWVPTARGPTGDHGLLQVRLLNHGSKVKSVKELYNPAVNLRVAYQVYQEAERGKFKDGFAPWYMSNGCHGKVSPRAKREIMLHLMEKTKLARTS